MALIYANLIKKKIKLNSREPTKKYVAASGKEPILNLQPTPEIVAVIVPTRQRNRAFGSSSKITRR